MEELHVVRVERVGHDQQRPLAGRCVPVGQVVVEAVAAVGEARLAQQPAGPAALAAAAEEAERPLAGRGLDRRDRAQQVAPLRVDVVVVRAGAPAPAVARALVARGDDRPGERGRALDRAAAHPEGREAPVLVERAKDPPDAGAHAVGELLLGALVPAPGLDDAADLGHALGERVAVGHRPLRALLEVDDQRDDRACAVRQARAGRRRTVAVQVPGGECGRGHRSRMPQRPRRVESGSRHRDARASPAPWHTRAPRAPRARTSRRPP